MDFDPTELVPSFTLAGLFGGDVSVVIPDMQRDYIWSLDPGGEKVTRFVEALISLFRGGSDAELGILYGYRWPAGSHNICIIDGQQRLTSLYLLVGMLYRRTPSDSLRRLLISDYELTDNREPRLLYQVRADALYFMSDVVTHFFLDRDGRLSQLERSSWYYRDYDSDPSVRSFVRALHCIDAVLEKAAATDSWSFADFADYVASRVRFAYYDLGSRHAAEDMFILLNTAGEPPSAVQHIKRRLVRDDEGYRLWNEMEQWFWQHRDRSVADSTSDPGMADFFALAERLHEGRLPGLRRVLTVFAAWRRLVDIVGMPPAFDSAVSRQYVLLPVLDFMLRFADAGDEAVADIYGYLHSIVVHRRYVAGSAAVADARAMVAAMPRPDVLSLLELPLGDRVLTDEERSRLTALAAAGSERRLLAAAIARAESHPVLAGRVERLLAWSTPKCSGKVDIGRLDAFTDTLYDIFPGDIDCSEDLDTVRRALLAMRHPAYPTRSRDGAGQGLCWRSYHWQRLFLSAPGLLRTLLERAMATSLHTVIDRFADTTSPFYRLIKDPFALHAFPTRELPAK